FATAKRLGALKAIPSTRLGHSRQTGKCSSGSCPTSVSYPSPARQVSLREGPIHFVIHQAANAALSDVAGMLSLISVYAQKFKVDVWIRGEHKVCPLEWLDQFCMRNFTNSAEFDDTLPLGDGRVEASFRLSPERFAEGLAAWLTQRGKGEGQPVRVE